MKNRRKFRIALNTAMFAALWCAVAFRITGETWHEIFGAGFAALSVLHIFFNRHWFAALFRGSHGFRRMLTVLVNAALLAAAFAVCFGGFVMFAAKISGFDYPMWVRNAHSISAYWLWILAAAHIGLHCPLPRRAVLRILCAALALSGVWAWGGRSMGEKLFLGYSFDFWNPDSPAALLFAQNFAVLFLVAFLTRIAVGIFNFKQRKG